MGPTATQEAVLASKEDSQVISHQGGGLRHSPQTDHNRAAAGHQDLSIIHCFPLGAGVKCPKQLGPYCSPGS